MKYPTYLFRDLTDDERNLAILRARLSGDFAEYVFRLIEMTLIVGAIVYLEHRLGSRWPIASTLAIGAETVYARSRATSGLLSLLQYNDLSARQQRLLYWLILALSVALFFILLNVVQSLVPMIARAQVA